ALRQALALCTAQAYRNCTIPLNFTSVNGSLYVTNLSVRFTNAWWNISGFPSKNTYRVRVRARNQTSTSSFDASNANFAVASRCAALTANTTLYSDILSNQETCFAIQANGVTLDCGGHTILGNGTLGGVYGVAVHGYNRTVIKNCVFRNMSFALVLNTTANNTLSNNTIDSALSGITCWKTYNTMVSDNSVNSTLFGIAVAGAFNIIADNFVSSSLSGLHVQYTYNTTYADNYLYRNTDGIYLSNDSANNRFLRTTILRSTSSGISFRHFVHNNTFIGVNLTNNSVAVSARNTSLRNVIINATIARSGSYDFQVIDQANITLINVSFNLSRRLVSGTGKILA
ncbi:hypothetical protein COY95_01445, partial [Candidatus Woesearchaeota archaeon CG_4_10_14_0_8_um_filter_47_5]